MDGKTNFNLTTIIINTDVISNTDDIKTKAMAYLVYKMGKLNSRTFHEFYI